MITVKHVWRAVAAALILMLTAGTPVPDEPYFSPFDLVVDSKSNLLYTAGATGNGVVQFDLEAGKVVRTFTLPDAPGGLALAPDGDHLYVTAWTASGGVHVVDLETGKISSTLPRGHFLCAPVLSPDGKTLFVCNRFENAVSVIDLDAEKVIYRIPVPREPVAAGITPDGKRLLVANHLPALPADGDYTAAEVTVIDTASMKTEASIALPNGSTGLRGLCLSPDGKLAFVTHILARYHLPTTQLERGWMNTNAVSIIDAGAEAPKLLNTVLLDDVDLGAAIPWGVACSKDGTRLLVTHAASHEVSIIDLPGLLKKLEASMEKEDEAIEVPNDLAYLVGLRQRIKLSGNGPRGIAIAGDRAYIAEYFTDSLGIIDFTKESRIRARSVAIRDPVPVTRTRKGEMFFNDARLCFQQWQSCASCHPDGRADGLNWDLLNDGFGNPKNTKSLLLAHETPPAMITGIRDSAEMAVRSGIRYIQFTVRPEEDAEAIDAYLKSLKPLTSPYLFTKGPSSPGTKTPGRLLFEQTGCAECHSGPCYTDLKKYDLGHGKDLDKDLAFDTPTLREIWRTAPYLYDGRAATIRDLLTTHNQMDRHGKTSTLTPEEISDLEAYVLSL